MRITYEELLKLANKFTTENIWYRIRSDFDSVKWLRDNGVGDEDINDLNFLKVFFYSCKLKYVSDAEPSIHSIIRRLIINTAKANKLAE